MNYILSPPQEATTNTQHYLKHMETYSALWDRELPNGQQGSSFEEYIEAVARPTTWCGLLEIRALSRMYDCRVTVVPRATTEPVFSVKPSQKQRIVVLLFTGIHFDALLPEAGKPLPKQIKEVVTEPPKVPMRGGGGSRCTVWTDDSCSRRSSGKRSRQTVWTVAQAPSKRQASAAPSCAAASAAELQGRSAKVKARAKTPTETRSVAKRPRSVFTDAANTSKHLRAQSPRSFPTAVARRTQVPGQVQEAVSDATVGDLSDCDQQALETDGPAVPRKLRKCAYRPVCPMPSDKIFRCKLCPFQKQVAGPESYKQLHHKHYRIYHGGEGLPGKFRGFAVKRLTATDGKAFWKCPLCKQGISTQVRDQITRHIFADMRNRHREQRHAQVPIEEWRRLMSVPNKGPKNIAEHKNRARALKLNSRVSEQLQKPKYDGKLTMFLWPKARRHKGKQSIRTISFEHAWQCKKCGRCTKVQEQAKQHASGRCPKALSDTKKRRLAQLREARAWANKHCEPQERQQVLKTIDAAHKALQEESTSSPSQGF